MVVLIDDQRAPSDAAARARIQSIVPAALTRGPTVVVAVGSPYGLGEVSPQAARLATYASDPASLRAAAQVLLGTLRPQGRLPVSLHRPAEPPSEPLHTA